MANPTALHQRGCGTLPSVVSLREAAVVAVGLAVLILVQLAGTDSFYLLQKHFWTDEICTHTVLNDADPAHVFHAIRGGVEINPPGLHLLLFAFTTLVNSTSEMALRSFALLSMVVALAAIYAALRESVSVLVSLAATLSIWAHPLILDHAFEVRYYGPWLAAAAWCCVLLARARAGTLGSIGTVGLGVTSFFLCTIHYFGIVTLILIVLAEWWWSRGQPRLRPGAIAPIAAGPLATAAAVAFLLPYQRSATTVRTWVPDPTAAQIVDFGTTLLLPLHLAAVPLVIWLSRLTTRAAAPTDEPARVSAAAVGLTGLALLAPALVVFSFLAQPALISRYGLPAIAALAPAVAFTVSRVHRIWVLLLIGFLISSSAFQIRQRAIRAQGFDRAWQELIRDIREHTDGEPVAFEVPHDLNVVWHYAEDLRGRIFLIDFQPGELGDRVAPFRIWSRDLARQFGKFYDGPPLRPWADVRDAASVFVVPHPEAYTGSPDPHERYPRFRMTPVRGQLHKLVKADKP